MCTKILWIDPDIFKNKVKRGSTFKTFKATFSDFMMAKLITHYFCTFDIYTQYIDNLIIYNNTQSAQPVHRQYGA